MHPPPGDIVLEAGQSKLFTLYGKAEKAGRIEIDALLTTKRLDPAISLPLKILAYVEESVALDGIRAFIKVCMPYLMEYTESVFCSRINQSFAE